MVETIPLKRIQVARDSQGNLLNPRGERFTSTDLQDSFGLEGQRREIEVVALADDTYLLLDGHRRLQAAEALCWKELRAVVKELPQLTDSEILVQMLTSDMQQPFKPTQLGLAFKRLMLDKKWGIERVAALRGIAVEKARLYLDLLEAVNSIQERVDAGEMTLSAFALLRNQPEVVQERAAALPKPTKASVQSLVRKEAGRAASDGVMVDLFAQMAPEENAVVSRFYDACNEVRSQFHRMMPQEQEGIILAVQNLFHFVTPEQQAEGAENV